MIFCKGTLAYTNILKNCFDIYAQLPWQIINLSKSKVYTGYISRRWVHLIANLLGFSLGFIEELDIKELMSYIVSIHTILANVSHSLWSND